MNRRTFFGVTIGLLVGTPPFRWETVSSSWPHRTISSGAPT